MIPSEKEFYDLNKVFDVMCKVAYIIRCTPDMRLEDCRNNQEHQDKWNKAQEEISNLICTDLAKKKMYKFPFAPTIATPKNLTKDDLIKMIKLLNNLLVENNVPFIKDDKF